MSLYSAAGLAHYVVRGRAGSALRGKLAALLGVPRVLSARRSVQRARRADVASVEAFLDRGWLSVKRREKSL